MTTGIGPYVTPVPDDANLLDDTVLETTITASIQTVNIGGVTINDAETYNGEIPGPTLRLDEGRGVARITLRASR